MLPIISTILLLLTVGGIIYAGYILNMKEDLIIDKYCYQMAAIAQGVSIADLTFTDNRNCPFAIAARNKFGYHVDVGLCMIKDMYTGKAVGFISKEFTREEFEKGKEDLLAGKPYKFRAYLKRY